MRTVSDNIIQLFEESGKKQKDLADYVGVNPVTVGTWVHGVSDPLTRFIPWIAAFFEVPIERLFKGVMCLALILIMGASADADFVTAPNGLNVRAERSTDSAVVEVLPFGTEITPLKIGKKWAKLDNGFVSTEWISDSNPLDTMQYMGEWRITAYAYTGSPCANGEYPEAGRTVACNSLPFGTEVYIDGAGFRTVTDRGPASMGSEWIDLYLGDYGECVQWGDQRREVWVK